MTPTPNTQAAEARREIGKWLNEETNRPVDRMALAILCDAFDARQQEVAAPVGDAQIGEALLAWHGKRGYSDIEKMRAAINAASRVPVASPAPQNPFVPGSSTELNAIHAVVMNIGGEWPEVEGDPYTLRHIKRMAREIQDFTSAPVAVEPTAWKWEVLPDTDHYKRKGAKEGVYLENPASLGIPMDHPSYRWTNLYATPPVGAGGAGVMDARPDSVHSDSGECGGVQVPWPDTKRLYIVMNEQGSEGVVFDDIRDAEWTQSGEGFGSTLYSFPCIGEDFRESYGDGKLTLHRIDAAILAKGGDQGEGK